MVNGNIFIYMYPAVHHSDADLPNITADLRIIGNIDPFNQLNRIMALINIHICLFVIPSILIMSLRICSWNSRGVNAAKQYQQELMNENDIVVICEHQLFEAEMYKLN